MPTDTAKEREQSKEALKVETLRQEAIITLFRRPNSWPIWQITKVMGGQQLFVEDVIRRALE